MESDLKFSFSPSLLIRRPLAMSSPHANQCPPRLPMQRHAHAEQKGGYNLLVRRRVQLTDIRETPQKGTENEEVGAVTGGDER